MTDESNGEKDKMRVSSSTSHQLNIPEPLVLIAGEEGVEEDNLAATSFAVKPSLAGDVFDLCRC